MRPDVVDLAGARRDPPLHPLVGDRHQQDRVERQEQRREVGATPAERAQPEESEQSVVEEVDALDRVDRGVVAAPTRELTDEERETEEQETVAAQSIVADARDHPDENDGDRDREADAHDADESAGERLQEKVADLSGERRHADHDRRDDQTLQ